MYVQTGEEQCLQIRIKHQCVTVSSMLSGPVGASLVE